MGLASLGMVSAYRSGAEHKRYKTNVRKVSNFSRPESNIVIGSTGGGAGTSDVCGVARPVARSCHHTGIHPDPTRPSKQHRACAIMLAQLYLHPAPP